MPLSLSPFNDRKPHPFKYVPHFWLRFSHIKNLISHRLDRLVMFDVDANVDICRFGISLNQQVTAVKFFLWLMLVFIWKIFGKYYLVWFYWYLQDHISKRSIPCGFLLKEMFGFYPYAPFSHLFIACFNFIPFI